MVDNSSDEYEEKNNKVLREGMPQRGKDMDPVPPAPANSKCHQTPSYGLERVGWYRESQKHRKEKKKTSQLTPQQRFSEDDDDDDEYSSETDSDSDDDDEEHGAPLEHLPVSAKIQELFQYTTVGDIEALDNLGLLVLDKPSTKQSDPTVLSLWLTENSKQHNITKHMKVKSLEDAEKNTKAIDIISELHHSKPPATVHYTRPPSDIGMLMQEWSLEFEELLVLVLQVSLPTAQTDCSLAEYTDMIRAILDIPVYKSWIQSLHLLFSLYSEFKNSAF
uniref:Intraflagellar transport protein 46 homolog n=1 Tax=Saimiri boliviensis boliviensis TaxID=39432 RepID=A0A2K6UKS7_SAIBB